MIGIRISSQFIILYPSTRIVLKVKNQLFNDGDIIQGDHSLTFDVPGGDDCPENAALLGNPDVIAQSTSERKVVAELWLGGTPYEEGLLVIKRVNLKSYSVAFLFGLSTISNDFKTKKLRDLIGGLSRTIHGTRQRIIYIKPTGSLPYRIKVNGTLYESNISLSHLSNQISVASNGYFITGTHNTTTNTSLGVTPPFIEIRARNPADVGQDLSYQTNYELFVEAAEDTDAERSKWYVEAQDESTYHGQVNSFMANYITENPADDAVRFCLAFNDRTYGEELVQDNKVVNGQKDSAIVLNDANYGVTQTKPFTVQNSNTLHPFIRLRWLLDQIATYFNFSFEGDFFTPEILDKKLIWNTKPASYAERFIGSKKYIVHKQSFLLKELVPDISVIDLLKALQNRYNLSIYYNDVNGNIVLQKRSAVWNDLEYIDITPISSPQGPMDPDSIKGVLLRAHKDPDDIYSVDDQLLVGEEAEQEIIANCGSASSNRTETTFDEDQPLTGALFGQPINDKFLLRIFYDTGWIATGDEHYRGSSNKQSGLPEEKFEGVDGIYELEYKKYLRSRLKQKLLALNVNFELRDLLQITNTRRLRFNRSDFFYREITADFTMNGLAVSDLKMTTI